MSSLNWRASLTLVVCESTVLWISWVQRDLAKQRSGQRSALVPRPSTTRLTTEYGVRGRGLSALSGPQADVAM